MAVRVTCTSKRHDEPQDLPEYAYTGPLPEYVWTYECDDPFVVWLGLVRDAYRLGRKQYSWIDAGFYPLPDGEPWSARGIVPDHLPYASEVWFSIEAWKRRLPGSRTRFQLETLDAGFCVTWTLEII